MKDKLKSLLESASSDYDMVAAIAEDFRKLAVTAIGVGIIGLAVAGDTITSKEAGLVLLVGMLSWIYGIILTKLNGKNTKEGES